MRILKQRREKERAETLALRIVKPLPGIIEQRMILTFYDGLVCVLEQLGTHVY